MPVQCECRCIEVQCSGEVARQARRRLSQVQHLAAPVVKVGRAVSLNDGPYHRDNRAAFRRHTFPSWVLHTHKQCKQPSKTTLIIRTYKLCHMPKRDKNDTGKTQHSGLKMETGAPNTALLGQKSIPFPRGALSTLHPSRTPLPSSSSQKPPISPP